MIRFGTSQQAVFRRHPRRRPAAERGRASAARLRIVLCAVWPVLLLGTSVLVPVCAQTSSAMRIEITDFRQVQQRDDGSREYILAGDRAVVNGTDVTLRGVSLTLLDAAGGETLQVQAPECRFDRERGVGRDKGPIRATGPALTLAGVGYVVNAEEQTLSIHSQVKMTMQAVPLAATDEEDHE